MAQFHLKGSQFHTQGHLPKFGEEAPDFTLVAGDLSEKTLASFEGKLKVLNVFPSLDTGTCQLSVKRFDFEAKKRKDIVFLNISKDTPFAQGRFCKLESLSSVINLSAFSSSFAQDYGLEIIDGPMKGFLARSQLVLDLNNKVIYSKLNEELSVEPDYEALLKVL